MKKVYVVSVCDREDGGHLLDESIFETAKEAREEFLRVKDLLILHDTKYSKQTDVDYMNYVNFGSDYFDLNLSVKEVGTKMELRHIIPTEDANYVDYRCVEHVAKCISELSVPSSGEFEPAYDAAKIMLDDSFVASCLTDGKMVINVDPSDHNVYGFVNIIVSENCGRYKTDIETCAPMWCHQFNMFCPYMSGKTPECMEEHNIGTPCPEQEFQEFMEEMKHNEDEDE